MTPFQQHALTCEICDLTTELESETDTGRLAEVVAKTLTTRWIGGFTGHSSNPTGTILSAPGNGAPGIAFFHYTWSTLWFLFAMADRGLLRRFADDYVIILIEEVAGHTRRLLPLFDGLRSIAPRLTFLFSVVDDRDAAMLRRRGYLARPGGADAWIDAAYWCAGEVPATTDKVYDVMMCSTGRHNNLRDVKRVDALMGRYVREQRKERVAIVYFDGEGEQVRLAARLFSDRVRLFDAALPREGMRRLYRSSRCFGMMSRHEGGSRYLAEAVSAGCIPIMNTAFTAHHALSRIERLGGRAVSTSQFWDTVNALATRSLGLHIAAAEVGLFCGAYTLKAALATLSAAGISANPPEGPIFLHPEIEKHRFRPFPAYCAPCLPDFRGAYKTQPSLPHVDFQRVLEQMERTLCSTGR